MLTRTKQCDEGTAAVSRLDVHIQAYCMAGEGSADMCVCVCVLAEESAVEGLCRLRFACALQMAVIMIR